MPRRKRSATKVRPAAAKEISVLAWIQDAYGSVLLVQQSAGKQLWSLPGGKVRAGEGLKQGLRREIKEEIGLTVVSAKVIDLFDRPQRHGLAVLFLTKLRKGNLKMRDGEILSARFVNKLPPQATPSVRYFWSRQFPPLGNRGHHLDL